MSLIFMQVKEYLVCTPFYSPRTVGPESHMASASCRLVRKLLLS